MDVAHYQILLIAAGMNGLASLLLALRALHSRAGTWACVWGLVQASGLAALALHHQGHELLLVGWWLAWALLPALLLPLSAAVANIGLLRQLLLFFNICLMILATGASYWVYSQWQEQPLGSVTPVLLPSGAWMLLAWAGVLWAAALLDSLLQLWRQKKPQDRLRQAVFLAVLLLLGGGYALDAYALMGLGLQAWGFVLSSVAFLLLAVQLWIRPGPRRISGTVTPAIIQSTALPMLIADGDGRIQAVNDSAVRMLDQRRYRILGNDIAQVLGFDMAHLDSVSRLHGAGYLERVQIEVKAVKATREVALQPTVLRAKNGEVLAAICSLHPGSEDPSLAATSLEDPITGLAGAALGEALLARELRRHMGGSGPLVAAVYLRVQDAHLMATRHGQVLYERIQNAIAERLDAVCDWPLDIARTAGGGFVLVLTQVNDQQEVMEIAEQARALLTRPFKIDDKELSLPVLVSVIPDLRVYHELVDLLADARQALEQARHKPHEIYVAQQRGQERVAMALALEAAISTDALDLQLEPVVDLRSQMPCGVRVRMRWAPEGMAEVGDQALRRLARRVHLEAPLSQWRMQKLQEMSWGKGWAVWLPVDLEELQSPSFVKALPKVASRLPFKLNLELPDSVWLLPMPHKIAQALVKGGIGLHAKDFSAGCRVVTHAGGLHPKAVTIAANLVQTPGPAVDEAVRGLAAIAHAQGASTLALGVRKQSDLQRIHQLGVAMACGEFVGPLMSTDEFHAWLVDDARLKAKFAGLGAGQTSNGRKEPVLS